MRTRGAVEDLVVVDLDDPDEVASLGPDAPRRHFEDHYAELPFGLGTVPRRLEHDGWFTRPGVLLWIAIALIGLLALAGSGGGGADPAPAPPEAAPAFSPFGVQTGMHLALYHVGKWSELDVDAMTLLPLPRRRLPPTLAALPDGANVLGVLPQTPTRVVDYRGRTMCLTRAAAPRARFEPGGCAATEESIADLGALGVASLDGRFFFVAAAGELLVIDATEDGSVRRVDMQLPPFEALFLL